MKAESASRPLRIVVASEFYRPSRGGTQTTTENLARGLAALGHQVLVIAPGPSFWRSRAGDEDGQRILRVRSLPNYLVPKLRSSLWPYGPISRALEDFRPDIIQINNHFGIGRACLRYGRNRGMPVAAGLHFMPESFLFNVRRISPALYSIWRKAWWQHISRIYNAASYAVGPSQQAIDYLLQSGLTIPASVISNGIDLSDYHPLKQSASVLRRELGLADRPTAIYVGRISPEKQLDVLIIALAKAVQQEQTLDAQLVILGDGWTRQHLQSLAQRCGVSDRVIFTGYVPSDELKRRYIAAADVFVIPSTAELQSIVTLEAMAEGKPVAAVSEGALPELVKSGQNGELFGARDSAALARIYLELLKDPQRLHRYGESSRRLAQKHNLANMPRHYEELYRAVLAKSSASPRINS